MRVNSLKKIPEEYLDIKEWPAVEESSLREKTKSRYIRLREGVELYLSNHSMKDVCERAKIGKRRFHILIDRCLLAHRDGRIWGLRALIKKY